MNNINSAKTLYMAIAFGLALGAIVLFAMPTNVAQAQLYPTGSSDYTTSTGNTTAAGYTATGHTSTGYTNLYGNSNGNHSNGNGNGSNSNTNGTVVIGTDSKPIVSTETATDIKTTSALIQGAAHVDSGTATVWFEWGTRVDKLDHSTRSVYIDNMSTGDSEMLTNLTPGTKYYFRVVAHNSSGTCYGIVRSFVTKGGVVSTTTSTGSKTIIKKADASSTVSDSSIKGSLSASAANAGSGSGFIPSSVLGWLVIIILVFLIAIVVRAIQREAEEKKLREAEEAKRKLATA